MRDQELTQRPGKGWTPWTTKGSAATISSTWWQAKKLHFPKLNVSVYFDGSDLVGIEDWGSNPPRWCMKKPPGDWTPRPPGYLEEAERAWKEWMLKQRR